MQNFNFAVLVVFLVALIPRAQSQACTDTYPSCFVNDDCRSDAACSATCSATTYTCNYGTMNCTATGQHCDVQNGACRDCFTDAQCAAKNNSKNYCNTNTGTCVACLTSANCASRDDCGAACTTAFACTAGPANGNCSVFPYGVCVGNQCSGECSQPSDTAINYGCQKLYNGSKNYCVNVGGTNPYACRNCTRNSHCESLDNCNAVCNANVCNNAGNVLNCTALNFSYCRVSGGGGTGTCATCQTSAECVARTGNANAVCGTVGANSYDECYVSCQLNFQCRTDKFCNASCTGGGVGGGYCNYTNATGLDCTAIGQICNTQTGTCIECNTGDATPCVAKKAGTFCAQNTCSQCDPINNITSTQVCAELKCGAYCNATNRTCDGGITCASNEYCEIVNLGLLQRMSRCTPLPPPANNCTNNNQCPNVSMPYCNASFRCAECTQDSHCQIKLGDCAATCSGGKCNAGSPPLNCSATNGTRVCDMFNKQCRECVSGADCTNSSKPFCDNGGTYTCRQCTGNTNCFRDSTCYGTCTGAGVCDYSAGGPCNCTGNSVNKFCAASGNNGYCSECETDSDCGLARPHCRRSQITNVLHCYECLNNNECQSAQKCDSYCSSNTAGTCTASTLNCTDLYGLTAQCIGGVCIECNTDGDCAGKSGGRFFCNRNTNRCVQCTQSANCRSDTNCNAVCSSNMCTNGGGQTLNCDLTGQACATGTGTCVACALNTDCTNAAYPYCDGTGNCVACTQSSQCRSNSNCNAQCSGGKCYNVNNVVVSCGAGSSCTAYNTCEECTNDANCSASKPHCVTDANGVGRCMPCRPPTAGGTSITYHNDDCRTDGDCNATCVLQADGSTTCSAGGLVCSGSTPRCLPTAAPPTCVGCINDAQCTNGKGCNLRDMTCTLECTSNAACNTPSSCGATCVAGVCQRALAVACSGSTAVCTAAGKCVQCLTSADCPNGNSCGNNKCGYCTTSVQCRSAQRCTGATCVDNSCAFNNSQACPAPSTCDTTAGVCLECVSSTTCPTANPFCVNNKCAPCSGNNHAPCRSDGNCNAICSGNTCVASTPKLSCGAGQTCNTATGACRACTTSCPSSASTLGFSLLAAFVALFVRLLW